MGISNARFVPSARRLAKQYGASRIPCLSWCPDRIGLGANGAGSTPTRPNSAVAQSVLQRAGGKEGADERRIGNGGWPFFLFFLTTALVGLLVRKPPVHEILAPVIAFMVLVFIAMMFAKVGQVQ